MKLSEALDQYVYICLQAMWRLRKYNPRYKSLKPLGNRLELNHADSAAAHRYAA